MASGGAHACFVRLSPMAREAPVTEERARPWFVAIFF